MATTLSTEVSKKPLFSPKKHYLPRGFQKYDPKKQLKTIGFPIDNHQWMISAPWGSTETSREDCRHQSAGWKHGALSSWRRGDLNDTKPRKHGDFDSWCEVLFEVGDFNDRLRDFNHCGSWTVEMGRWQSIVFRWGFERKWPHSAIGQTSNDSQDITDITSNHDRRGISLVNIRQKVRHKWIVAKSQGPRAPKNDTLFWVKKWPFFSWGSSWI